MLDEIASENELLGAKTAEPKPPTNEGMPINSGESNTESSTSSVVQ
jgi:hypothetical protein